MTSIPFETKLKWKPLLEKPGKLLLICETLHLVSAETVFTSKAHKTQRADKALCSGSGKDDFLWYFSVLKHF